MLCVCLFGDCSVLNFPQISSCDHRYLLRLIFFGEDVDRASKFGRVCVKHDRDSFHIVVMQQNRNTHW